MPARCDHVFLHGGGQAGWVWNDLIAMISQRDDARVGALLALDAPGCGAKRGRDTGALAMADVADELISDIERAGLSSVVLVGHSQAGQAMPLMARLRPDLFRRLIYVTCSAPLPGQSLLGLMGTGEHESRADEVGWVAAPDMPARLETMFCNDMTADQATRFMARLGRDMWPATTYTETGWDYGGITAVPSTYVVCRRDLALPAEWQEIFAERLGVDRIVSIDAGHQAMISRPQELAAILVEEALRD